MVSIQQSARTSDLRLGEAPWRQDEEVRLAAESRVRAVSALRALRRTSNNNRGARVDQLRCECALRECRATVPAVAGAHRERAERFIVLPGHVGWDTVVAAADRFFVVEPSEEPRR